jgi:hypothetical protein
MVNDDKQNLERLYGDVNNLQGLIHPKFNEKFKFISKEKLIELSGKLVKAIKKSGVKYVVVSETGASPLAFICRKILQKQGITVHWVYVKFPREAVFNQSAFLYYLTDKERKEKINEKDFLELKNIGLSLGLSEKQVVSWKNKNRSEIINDLCQLNNFLIIGTKLPDLSKILIAVDNYQKNNFDKAFNLVFKKTSISRKLNQPFLYFDEYVDSGSTLFRATKYFQCLAQSPSFKILSYCVKINNSASYDLVYYSLYDRDTERAGYRLGVYPFENRVDLIGYFYFLNDEGMVKETTGNIWERHKNSKNYQDGFIKILEEFIEKHKLLEVTRQGSKIKQVQDYIDKNLIIQYLIYYFEKTLKKDDLTLEFTWLLFDMYGPIWSPMPIRFHFDFWDTFENLKKRLDRIKINDILKQYAKDRAVIIKTLAFICVNRRKNWEKDINKLINKKYGH